MGNGITYVGLDVHVSGIEVAVLAPRRREPEQSRVAYEPRAIGRLARKLKRKAPGRVVSCYEAGPCGYELQRRLEAAGVECVVVAPSLIPVKPGDRIKTDRRDARKLARTLRAGDLTEVHPPSPKEEAVRDLCRCREDAKEDLMRARHRLSKFLLRRGLIWRQGRNWSRAHHLWLRKLSFEDPADQAVLEDYLVQVSFQEERVGMLDGKIEEAAGREPYREAVGWLRCLRGIDTLTALTILAEIHDFRRFPTARHLMAYLGLVPSEDSSGQRKRRGAITKAGNGHARRVLIEAAWHARHKPAVGAPLRRRRQDQPRWAIEVADRAQRRLYQRYWRLALRGKPHNVVTVAVARELVGFLWALMREGAEKAA